MSQASCPPPRGFKSGNILTTIPVKFIDVKLDDFTNYLWRYLAPLSLFTKKCVPHRSIL